MKVYKDPMNSRRTLTILLLLASMLGASACKKKKPPVPPPQAHAPTIVQPQPDTPGPTPPMGAEPSRPLPTPGEVAVSVPPTKPAPKPKTHITRKTVPPPAPEPPKQPPAQAAAAPQQSGQLTASLTNGEALRQKLDTAQLISATENNLKSVNHALNAEEQATLQHIRTFIKQSQSATSDGDLEMAYKLATKAHLLSTELIKPK